MNILDRLWKKTQPPPPTSFHASRRTRDENFELCAYFLYYSVRPTNGLYWHQLSEGQQNRYREFTRHAQALTDLTPVETRDHVANH